MIDISRQYALALFSLIESEAKEDEMLKLLEAYQALASEESLKLFKSPKISLVEKKNLLSSLVNDDLFKRFLFVLIDNNRIDLLRLIFIEYHKLIRERNQEMHVLVFTKKPLSSVAKTKIENKLARDYRRKVILEERIDETIIAGIRMEFDSLVIDETVNYKLDKMKSDLKKMTE